VFSPAWQSEEACLVDVAIATVSDYVADFKDFLLGFWAGRLGPCLLEEFVTHYARAIVSRGPKPQRAAPGTSISAQAVSMQKTGAKQFHSEQSGRSMVGKVGSMFGFGKKKQEESPAPAPAPAPAAAAAAEEAGGEAGRRATAVPEDRARNASVMPVSKIRASAASTAQIERDMKSIYVFFSDKCDEEAFNDAMAVLEDILELLSAESDDLGRILMGRINQYPPSTQAIVEVAQRCVALRDDLVRGIYIYDIYGTYVMYIWDICDVYMGYM
jgi:hypothetical protein